MKKFLTIIIFLLLGIVAFSQTTIPPSSTWTPARNIINANFVNTYDSIAANRLRVNILNDSILAYATAINLRLLKSDSTLYATRSWVTGELSEFGTGNGDVVGADTIAATRVALWSGQDSLTGDARFTYVSSGNGNLTHTGYTTNLSSTIINFGTSTSGTGVIRGAATNGPAIINRTPTSTTPNLAIHKSYTESGIGGTYGSGTSSIAVIVSGATKFQSFDTYNNSFVPLYTPASTSSLAGFRLPHGTAPSTPTNGDLWTTTGGIFTQINGSTDTLATQEYARQYGGTGTVTISDVQNEIADSLNAIRPSIAVGDGTVGPFFDGSEDGGQILYFYGDNGFYTALQGGAPTANRSYRLPIAALPSTGTTSLMNIDEYGNMGFVPYTNVIHTADSTGNAPGNYVTRKALNDSIAANLGSAVGITLNSGTLTLTGDAGTADDISFYTNGDGEYNLPAGGGNLTIMSQVQGWINDSLDARIGAGIELSDVAVMIADSTGNAAGNYVTRKALIDSIAAAGTGTGVSIIDVRDEIADSLNAIRSNSIPGLAAVDTVDLVATHYYVATHGGSSWDSTYVHYRIDSLVTVIDGLNTEIENLWNAVALLGDLDIHAPGFQSAEIGTYADDTLLVILDATDVQQDSIPPASAFTLWDGATEHGVASVDINADSLFLVLDSAAVYGSTYTLDYTRGTPALQDSSGNKTSSWTARSVTNNMEEPAASGLLSGLTAYWDMQESSLPIVDEVASLTSTGTVGSTAIELSMAGRISNSMEFNYLPTYGGGQRIIVGDDLLQHGTISVSLWFYLTSTDQDAFCMIHNTNPGTQNRGYYFFTGGVGGGVAVRAYNSSGTYVEVDSDPSWEIPSANTWYHAVFVADGTNLTVYVNGVQRAQSAFAYDISYGSDATLIIGGRDSANGWTMNGRLDEIGMWNRALTTDEITALYNGGSGLAYSSFGN